MSERKRLEKAILEISSEEQRRIGQDLHDGLGQHLTGIAFMSKVQEQKLSEKGLAEAAEAARIVRLVNEAIHKTRQLAHGLLPVGSDAHGLFRALLAARRTQRSDRTNHVCDTRLRSPSLPQKLSDFLDRSSVLQAELRSAGSPSMPCGVLDSYHGEYVEFD